MNMFIGREFTFYISKQQRNAHFLEVGHDPCWKIIFKWWKLVHTRPLQIDSSYLLNVPEKFYPQVYQHIQVIFIQTIVENLIFGSHYHFAWKFCWENIGRWSAEKRQLPIFAGKIIFCCKKWVKLRIRAFHWNICYFYCMYRSSKACAMQSLHFSVGLFCIYK